MACGGYPLRLGFGNVKVIRAIVYLLLINLLIHVLVC